jgi:hypothetical protein
VVFLQLFCAKKGEKAHGPISRATVRTSHNAWKTGAVAKRDTSRSGGNSASDIGSKKSGDYGGGRGGIFKKKKKKYGPVVPGGPSPVVRGL